MPPPPEEPHQRDRVLVVGRPNYERCDNTIITARYTLLTFLPVAIKEQFRRFANQYFLVVGIIMGIGYYFPNVYESAISPWTTLGPLAFVISISLLVEGSADRKRHKNDYETNSAPCVILRNVEEWDAERHSEKGGNGDGMGEREPSILNGQDITVNLAKPYHSNLETPMASGQSPNSVKVAFQRVNRKDIRQGHLVLVRNREMVPADVILLASSNDNGSAYIETSSIDGETNLKLRNSPHLPKSVLQMLQDRTLQTLAEDDNEDSTNDDDEGEDGPHVHETLEQATKRITRLSALANPNGVSALEHPNYVPGEVDESEEPERRRSSLINMVKGIGSAVIDNVTHSPASRPHMGNAAAQETNKYLATLTSEAPNPHVNTFGGKLTFPPVLQDGNALGGCVDVSLGADNILLRGAVIRNTEWVIGVACFTGTDTKLVQNSVKPPSKFSRLDKLMNRTVSYIICVMVLCISYLATQSVVQSNRQFNYIWYLGYSKDVSQPWPYLQGLEPPSWTTKTRNWAQLFFLYVTLLNNFVPLSLYVTVEIITFSMLALIYVDLDMYDDTTDTRAVARSTIVTDLGQVQYIFSDKTGTLTQNVMRFKRCSVDGLVFGAPIQKSRPGAEETTEQTTQTPFHPLRQLLVGRISVSEEPSRESMTRHSSPGLLPGLEQFGVEVSTDYTFQRKLTFNAEMFLRVMSLCHTVVVEKDLDQKTSIDSEKTVNSSGSTWSNRASLYAKKLLGGKRASADFRGSTVPKMIGSPLPAVSEEGNDNEDFSRHSGTGSGNRSRFDSTGSALSNPGSSTGKKMPMEKGADGAPMGYAYQAESPDEGALVEAASARFGFQVIGRDSSGIKLRCTSASHFLDGRVVQGLKNGTLTPKALAADTADEPFQNDETEPPEISEGNERYETWSILAVNKFDSDRKRMSILLRSPVEMGEFPILLCKGADSAMLDPSVCSGGHTLLSSNERQEDISKKSMDRQPPAVPTSINGNGATNGRLSAGSALDAEVQEEWEMAQMLGIQAHLGDFASEGLRTLVLGMRVLSEDECSEWLEKYKEAATTIKNRDEKLKEAALAIEREIHVVGATAIEDKLQKGVPNAIATLGQAGIKLWVLTGDKKETAIEIGYATHVLTPKMHLTEASDKGESYVRTQMAMEFIRLVKSGKLPLYQRSVVDKADKGFTMENFWFKVGKCKRAVSRAFRRSLAKLSRFFCARDPKDVEALLKEIDVEAAEEQNILKNTERRRRVRNRAEKIIRDFLTTPEGQLQRTRRAKSVHSRPTSPIPSSPGLSDDDDMEDLTLTSDELPTVFNRAQSARTLLHKRKSQGRLSQSERRSLAIAQLTAQELSSEAPLVDEDTLSLNSFFVGDKHATSDFDKKKRTLLERLFAVDKEVRKGRLLKHVRKDKLAAIAEGSEQQRSIDQNADVANLASDGPRALVIEGAALKHLLGDPELEEIIFSVASNCDAVIACRVSPKQKALLVHLVRHHVVPEPVTLAIGDGANDVGMIQEAHVGVGISGKEGKQAVNSSDFAIAQFRFLEDLLLVHGRWNFFRMTTVVLFSFYKNAIMAGCLIAYTAQTLYSGTPLFDQWIIAVLNFVAGIPIIVLGLFDRCMDKSYVRRHPEVYKPTRNNELLTIRTQLRWICLVFVHIFTIYYMTVPTLAREGGGITSAFLGLMRNKGFDSPGDGEAGDLKSVGTVTFSCLITLLAYKVLYESRSLIHGIWPAFTFRKGVGEGFPSRLAYTWIGVTYCSIGFYLIFLTVYQSLGRKGAGTFSEFVDTANHVLATRSIHWMLFVFVPIFAMAFDVSAKVFSNMFYPTQTQIHIELEAMEKRNRRLGIGEHNFRRRTSVEA